MKKIILGIVLIFAFAGCGTVIVKPTKVSNGEAIVSFNQNENGWYQVEEILASGEKVYVGRARANKIGTLKDTHRIKPLTEIIKKNAANDKNVDILSYSKYKIVVREFIDFNELYLEVNFYFIGKHLNMSTIETIAIDLKEAEENFIKIKKYSRELSKKKTRN